MSPWSCLIFSYCIINSSRSVFRSLTKHVFSLQVFLSSSLRESIVFILSCISSFYFFISLICSICSFFCKANFFTKSFLFFSRLSYLAFSLISCCFSCYMRANSISLSYFSWSSRILTKLISSSLSVCRLWLIIHCY